MRDNIASPSNYGGIFAGIRTPLAANAFAVAQGWLDGKGGALMKERSPVGLVKTLKADQAVYFASTAGDT
jgi:hypothetical protein